jgi:hypothetical protein
MLTWDPAIAATRVALHSAVHDPAFIAHPHAIGKVATAFGLVPGSPARRAATQALSEGWETLWLSSRRLDPDWGRTLQYWREHTMLVARPIYLATFLQALPSGHIPKNVARKIVEASFGALFEAGWTETVSILRRQTMWLHTGHRAACRGMLQMSGIARTQRHSRWLGMPRPRTSQPDPLGSAGDNLARS